MDCFGTCSCFTHAETFDAKPPCKRPRSPLQRWRQPLSSPLQAPLKPLQASFKPLRTSGAWSAPWSPLQAPLKPSEGEAPLKPPSSPLEAPFKSLEASFTFERLQAPFKPSSSPLEALFKLPWSLPKVKPPSSPLEAPLEASFKPPSSPLEASLKPSEGEAPFDLQTFVLPLPFPQTLQASLKGASEREYLGTSPCVFLLLLYVADQSLGSCWRHFFRDYFISGSLNLNLEAPRFADTSRTGEVVAYGARVVTGNGG